MRRASLWFTLLTISLFTVAIRAAAQSDMFTVMEYNCENLFDTFHDEGKQDYEFLPDGERTWTMKRMANKLRGIAKVIAAANEHRPVDLVGLCEVENDTVMTSLTKRSALAPMGYKYVMTNSDDERGVDVALLYSPYTFHPFDTRSIKLKNVSHPTRDVLRVSGTVNTGDTLDVYVAHLPSRLGGGTAARLSIKIVGLLKADIDSTLQQRSKPNVIVMGDFNATTGEKQLRLLTRQTPLVDVAAKIKPGTYKYQGKWSVIDHILCHVTSLVHIQTNALVLPQLVENDPTHYGIKPRRTFLGPIYKGGVSDHLPVISRFRLK